MDEKTITISLDRFNELVEAENLLIALQSAGVDNWDGYSYAIEILDEMNEGK